MLAEYIQRHLNDARCQFYAAIHDAECEAVHRKTKRVLAKCTSKTKAKKQVRLLYAIDNNPDFQVRSP